MCESVIELCDRGTVAVEQGGEMEQAEDFVRGESCKHAIAGLKNDVVAKTDIVRDEDDGQKNDDFVTEMVEDLSAVAAEVGDRLVSYFLPCCTPHRSTWW